MNYLRIKADEREQIFALIHQNKSLREISKTLNRSHTTILREVARCGGREQYSPLAAEKHA